MGTINLSNSKNRDAIVNTESVRTPLHVRWLDEKGRQAQSVRILRSTVDRDCDELIKQAGALDRVAELLIKSDPEIDMEVYGRFLSDTSRVYMSPDKKVVRKVQEWEIVRNIDGSERERRPRKVALANTSTEVPLKWTGKLMKKAEVYNRFVFAAKMQIVHINGLTYDFLYGMAKELEAAESLMLLGAGPKGSQPLVFHRGGVQYRGFLEGRTQGEQYCLVLHLSNMELKAPEAPAAPPAPAGESPKSQEPDSKQTENTKTPKQKKTPKA